MLVSTALAFLALSPQTIALDEIHNGDFELSPGGIHGAQWVGAESLTIDPSGTDRYLSLSAGESVFQRAAVPHGAKTSLDLSAQVRIASGDTARFTVSEGSLDFDAVRALLLTKGAQPATDWSASEDFGFGWRPLVLGATGPESLYEFTSIYTDSEVSLGGATVPAGTTLQLEWTAASTRAVRVMLRPSRNDGQTGSATVETWYDVDGAGPLAEALLDTVVVASGDIVGEDVILRQTVASGSQLRFRMTTTASPSAKLYLFPTVEDLARRVTYEITTNAAAPSCNGDERVVYLPVQSNTWTTINPDFRTQFTNCFAAEAAGPYTVELLAPAGNSASVDFDDVSCTFDYDTATYAGLRATVLARVGGFQDSYRLQTRDTPFGGLTQFGAESVFQLRPMDYLSGASNPNPTLHTTCLPGRNTWYDAYFGKTPASVLNLLRVEYDDDHFADHDWIVEQRYQPLNRGVLSPAAYPLYYPRYNCQPDEWERTSCELTSIGNGGAALAVHQRSGDVNLLDVAFNYARNAALNGVLNSGVDPRDGVIMLKGYKVETGLNVYMNDEAEYPKSHQTMTGAVFMLKAYAACEVFNSQNPTLNRYPAADLTNILAAAEAAALRSLQLRTYNDITASWGNWDGDWRRLEFPMNDVWGYNANSAIAGIEALDTVVDPLPVATARGHLLNYVQEGGRHYFPHWRENIARSGPNAGDQDRCWKPYAWMVRTNNLAALTAGDVEAQLVMAARHRSRYQFPDSAWANTNADHFQLVDVAGGAGTPAIVPLIAASYSTTLSLPGLATSLEDEMLARFDTHHAETDALFGFDSIGNALPYGFKVFYDDAGNGGPAGTELRFYDNFLEAFELLDADLPTDFQVSISRPSLDPVPPSGTDTFTFTIEAPAGDNPTTMLNDRTRIVLWEIDANDEWKLQELWTPTGANTGFTTPNVVGQVVSLTYQTPVPTTSSATFGGRFKFELISWTTSDGWRKTTSYQEW